jgi:hypothetical protein
MKIHRYWPLILLGFSIVGLFNFCKLKEPLPTPPNDPTANFDADKYDCVAPCKIQFTNKSTGTGTLTYAWNFGDNIGTSTEVNPSYTYATAGTYTITLTTSGNVWQSYHHKTGQNCTTWQQAFRAIHVHRHQQRASDLCRYLDQHFAQCDAVFVVVWRRLELGY